MDIETDARDTDHLTVTSFCPSCLADMAQGATECPICGWEDEPLSPAERMKAHLAEFGR
jgi:anaerobic ribonucleoside-triphosphate reductase